MRLLQKPLVQEIEYKKNKEVKIVCPSENLHRRWTLVFFITIKAGATVPTNPKHNDFLNLIKKITVYHDGGKTRSSYSAVDKRFFDLFKHGTFSVKEALATPNANGTATMKYTMTIDFARRKKILSDYSALLDAPRSQSVYLGIEWGDISDIYGTVGTGDIDDATHCRVSIIEAYDDGIKVEGQPNLDEVRKNLVFIKEEISEHLIDKAYESFDADMIEAKILPVNSTMISQLFFTKQNITDGNPVFSDSVVTEIKIQNVEGAGEIIVTDFWANLVDATKTDYTLETLPAGMLFVDWLDQRQRGLIITAADALKMRLLTIAPAQGKKNSIRVYSEFVTADT